MKQFLLFAGEHYYPNGGWNDYRGAFDSVEAAVATIDTGPKKFDGDGMVDWYQVVDRNTGICVLQRSRKFSVDSNDQWFEVNLVL